MDGSMITGLASMVSLTDGGVIAGLILLAVWLYKHTAADREDRRRIYQKIEEKVSELHNDHKQLDAKIDRIAEAVARLEGYHEAERDKQ